MNKHKLENYIPEEEQNMLVDPNEMDDVPSVKIHIDDDNNMILQVSSFYHSGGNGKIALLKNNQILQDLLMKAIQQQAQKMFRHTVHGVLGEPYGLPENKTNKTMTNETKLWQRRAGIITESEYQKGMEEANDKLTVDDQASSTSAPTAPTAGATKTGLGDKPPATSAMALGTKLRDIGNNLMSTKSLTKGGEEVNMGSSEISNLDTLINTLLKGAGGKSNTASGIKTATNVVAKQVKP